MAKLNFVEVNNENCLIAVEFINEFKQLLSKYRLQYYKIEEESRGNCKYINVNTSIKL